MARDVIEVTVSGVADFAALGERWRDLESRAEGSFFQSWTWIGCLAAERYPDPVLVEATEQGRTIGLGLFNRVRRFIGRPRLYLGESGNAEADCPYIEQNGILLETGSDQRVRDLCLRRLPRSHDLVLSGIGVEDRAAVDRVAGRVVVRLAQAAPFADLAAIRAAGGEYLAGRSANARQQIRRSDRFYQQSGPITVTAADSVDAAHTMLASLAALHQAAWRARGRQGSFARPFFGRFHRALIQEGLPRGEISLLRVSSGDTEVGFLYNFHWRRRILAYQSGFAYPETPGPAKPGLTSHHAAIRMGLRQDFDVYDFLAGDDRYKRSLSDDAVKQFWLEAGSRWSPRLVLSRLAAGRRR